VVVQSHCFGISLLSQAETDFCMMGYQYLELLDTYSDHIALNKEVKEALYSEIGTAIKNSNDEIVIEDTIELYLAKKPSLA